MKDSHEARMFSDQGYAMNRMRRIAIYVGACTSRSQILPTRIAKSRRRHKKKIFVARHPPIALHVPNTSTLRPQLQQNLDIHVL